MTRTTSRKNNNIIGLKVYFYIYYFKAKTFQGLLRVFHYEVSSIGVN